jgi:diguanylate cyclase (GGDEF)-like protein
MDWSEEATGRGTVGTAIRTGERSLIRSIASHPRATPWQQEALSRGYRSVVSFPVKVDQAVIGALTLMATEENAFDEDEIELLDEMASDLSFGIAVIRTRIKREEAEQRAERAATHDSLTGLPNASWFLNRLRMHIGHAAAASEAMTVLVVHLPRLQDLYDSLGFDSGNAVVKAIAERLRELPVCADRLARTGLEDFAAALPQRDAASAASIVGAISSALHAPLVAGAANVEMQVAIGASFYPGHGDDSDLLLRRAGIAAREAARKGIDYLAYKGVTERENPARLEIAAELRSAIENRALHLHYQPKVDARTGELVAGEALLRWTHAVKGPISPAQFIPVAEQTGLIRPLTDLVLDMAVRQQRAWVEEGLSIPIAVNLSTRNLYDSRLLSRIDGLLNTWGISPELLEFEITESALMEEPDVARALIAALRARGSKIYIDDFGTGYSSLSYLVRLPVHALKIDRAFIVQMTKSAEAHAVVSAITSMAHSLQLKVVAEGVETERELALLRDMGCDQIQGYHTGRPMSADDFLKLALAR